MKSKIIILTAVLAVLASSCIPSLFPLYTQKDIVYDDAIIGRWDAGGGGTWKIEKLDYHPNAGLMQSTWTGLDEDSDPENMQYRLTAYEEGDGDTLEAEFLLHLLELDNQMYANFYPVSYELHHDFLSSLMIEANNFARIRITDEGLELQYFDPEYLEELIDKNRIRISHVELGDRILLTAPTKELQKFVIKYCDEKDAMLDADIYSRI